MHVGVCVPVSEWPDHTYDAYSLPDITRVYGDWRPLPNVLPVASGCAMGQDNVPYILTPDGTKHYVTIDEADQSMNSITAMSVDKDGTKSLIPGTKLVIPVAKKDFKGEGLIVQPGQTLAMLAQKYGTTEEKIKEFNNLSEIKEGMALLIPKV